MYEKYYKNKGSPIPNNLAPYEINTAPYVKNGISEYTEIGEGFSEIADFPKMKDDEGHFYMVNVIASRISEKDPNPLSFMDEKFQETYTFYQFLDQDF